MKQRIRSTALALTAGVALALSACIEDENVFLPEQTTTQQFFLRYVSMGNSITAGFMSDGINDSTQHLAYPVLIAARAGMGFSVPSFAMPGCPPPLVGVVDDDGAGNVVLEEDRVGGGAADNCALREFPAPPVVNNVAVPGAKVADAIDIDRPGNASNPLTTLINGGLSQVEAMRRARPTMVTAWLGNNDVLAAALAGDTSLMTPVDTFRVYYERMAASIAGSGSLGVALIDVMDVTVAPLLQPGLYYWLADSLGFAPKAVDESCAPTDSAGTPNPLSMNTVSWNAFHDTAIATVSCDPAAPYVLTPGERTAVEDRVDAFNAIIEAEIIRRDWASLDPTGVLESRLNLAGSGRHNLLRRCEGLTNTLSADAMVNLFNSRCPHPSAPNYFGSLVTFDGVHPSAAAHAIIAEELADEINERYDTELEF